MRTRGYRLERGPQRQGFCIAIAVPDTEIGKPLLRKGAWLQVKDLGDAVLSGAICDGVVVRESENGKSSGGRYFRVECRRLVQSDASGTVFPDGVVLLVSRGRNGIQIDERTSLEAAGECGLRSAVRMRLGS